MEHTYNEYQHYDAQNDDYREELDEWFLVSGDTDDFIFYGENECHHSEK